MPQFTSVPPLKAVIVQLSSKCYPWWESTIAKSSKSVNTRNLVYVSNKKHITLFWGLISFQRELGLIEKIIAVGQELISIGKGTKDNLVHTYRV